MEKFFHPRSIAIIGVNREKGKVGRTIFDNLIDKVKVFPVNPSAKRIGKMKCYPSILSINQKIDLAIVAVNRNIVPKILKEIGEKGTKNVIIISSGFSEVGNKKLTNEIKEIAEKYKIKIIGPNSMGIISNRLNMTFFKGKIKNGNVGFISQSGALGSGILDIIGNKGIKYFVSVGNQLNTSISDFLEYITNDKEISKICIYAEGLKNGEKLFNIAKKSKKEIIMLKGGKTKKGKKAAKTHTAAISTDYEIWKGVMKQANVKMVNSIREMLLSSYTKDVGKRALIITNAGGLGVLISDEISEFSKVVEIPDNIIKKLNEVLPPNWSHGNPIDIVGDANAERYKKVLDVVSKNKFFDFIIIGFTPQAMSEPEKTARIISKYSLPIFPVFVGKNKIKNAKKILNKKFIVIEDPTDLIFLRNIIK